MHEAPTARSASRRFAPATAVARFVTAATCCFGALLPPAPSRAQGGACPPDFGSGRLSTAADLRVSSVVVDGPSACTDGETISLDLLVGFTSTANERYDIGLFVADDGGKVIGGTSCTLGSLTPQTAVAPLFNGTDPAGLGPYRDLDGDACGDLQAPDGENFRRLTLDGVLCRDRDGDGDVDINGLVVWNQNANQGVCTDPGDPAQFFPDQSSKCELAPDYNLPITVEPEPAMVVEKRPFPEILLAPGGDVIFFAVRVHCHRSSRRARPTPAASPRRSPAPGGIRRRTR